MTAETWPQGGLFCKRYPSGAAARTAALRSRTARGAGVCTPPVVAEHPGAVLAFERIMPVGQPTEPQMLDLLAGLRRMPPTGLTRFDPFARIRPRLRDAPPAVAALAEALEAKDKALNWPEAGVVHGDFHPGQVLCDAAGRVWLIDLDDLALGPPEVDPANLAAWLATQAPCDSAAVAAAALARFQGLAPVTDPALMAHFCAIALLRRALKLAERGQDWALHQAAVSPSALRA